MTVEEPFIHVEVLNRGVIRLIAGIELVRLRVFSQYWSADKMCSHYLFAT